MDFRTEIAQHYTDPEGMISQVRDPQAKWTSGNHLLITGTYYSILSLIDTISEKDRSDFVSVVTPCEVEPGLFNRNKGRLDKEAHDDYIGVVSASYFLDAAFKRDVLQYGRAHWWRFDNDNDGDLESLFWRLPDFIPLVKAANGMTLNLFNILAFSVSLIANALSKKDDTSGIILRWLETQVMAKKSWAIDVEIAFWKRQILKKYPGGMGDVFGIYYGKDHPFATAMAGKI